MKTKRVVSFGSAFLLSLSSLLVIFVPQAYAAVRTWDGGGSDNNMTTAANWTGDAAPSAGDILNFPYGASVADKDVVNDFTAGTSFASINFLGATDSNETTGYTITGNDLILTSGITAMASGASNPTSTIDLDIELGANQDFVVANKNFLDLGKYNTTRSLELSTFNLTVDVQSDNYAYATIWSNISGSGSITKDSAGSLTFESENTFTGSLTVNGGFFIAGDPGALGAASAGTTFNDGSRLNYCISDGSDSDETVSEPLVFNTGTFDLYEDPLPVMYAGACSFGGGSPTTQPYKVTFSGDITIAEETEFDTAGTIKLTGGLNGNFRIKLTDGSVGKLVINSASNNSATPNGTYTAKRKVAKYEDNHPNTSVYVGSNETAIVTGTVGNTTVAKGGILKGTGTVGTLTADGTVAPGLSPGCLNSGATTFSDTGSLDVELGGTTACTKYDQLKVTGTVTLGNAKLNTSLYGGFKPAKGQKFTVIDNDGSDKVSGTFHGLPEGATFKSNGYVFKVSYKGGTGNDVVLTVQSLPTAPDTGFGLLMNNPILTVSLTTLAAGGIVLAARRYGYATSRR